MTGQFPDSVTFQGDSYHLTAVEGNGLFDPATRGLAPLPRNTAIIRGFVCHYDLTDERLVLRQLDVTLDGAPPVIEGISAWRKWPWAWRYDGLVIPVPFSGKLLVGRGDVPDPPRLHVGFRPAWLYAIVWDLTFEAGRLREAHDRSSALAVVRERLGAAGARPRKGEATGAWVDRTFSLSYAYSWPDIADA